MKYDVVIVGGGPAGMATAHILINNNISCCVIDKQVFPRDKLCAGGVTGKALDLLKKLNINRSFNGENTVVSSGASLYVEYNHIIDIDTKSKTHLVDRFEFDDYLVSSYKDKGGAIIEGTKVSYIRSEQKKLMLANNSIVEFEYIVGADGAVGITSALVDKKFKSNGFSLQVDIQKDKFKYESDKMSLFYGIIPNGYGWIFPKESYVTIGIGSDYNKNIDYKIEFETFLEKLGIDYTNEKVRGAFLPFGECINNPINKEKNVILVGDAAGFADPITGEGIYFALLSGIKAGEIITKAINCNDREVLNKYIDEIRPITSNINKGRKLKKPLYKYRRVAFTPLKNEKIADILFNKCMYESSYNLNLQKLFK